MQNLWISIIPWLLIEGDKSFFQKLSFGVYSLSFHLNLSHVEKLLLLFRQFKPKTIFFFLKKSPDETMLCLDSISKKGMNHVPIESPKPKNRLWNNTESQKFETI